MCMGSEYSLCMNPAFFVTIPVPPFSAYQFVSFFNQMHYICGAGLQSNLFRSEENCGKNSRDSQFWGCEYARVNVFTRFPQCSFFCILPKAGGIVG
uniref:BPTI/Kunitz inhibitor domain-containing protein n=1 Tax=Heterorhabditis bacteriophora TaxID=37862 RepID=A0A1I7WYM4_HETBA